MKIIKKYCDRCKSEIPSGHEDVTDFLQAQYPGKDICPDCDLLLTLSKSLLAADLINSQKLGTSLSAMIELYFITPENFIKHD